MTSGQIAALVLIAVVAVTVGAFAVHLRRQDHPEDTASHEGAGDGRRAGPTDATSRGGRPGGPGAEGMAVADPGEIIPGSPTARAAERAD